MSFEVHGKIIAKPASETGTSQRGDWKKAYLVVRYDEGQYPKDILLSTMRKAEEFEKAQVGQAGTFKFDTRTRQSTSNGKYYCDIECWDLTMDQVSSSPDPI